jgi:hypothetical protein
LRCPSLSFFFSRPSSDVGRFELAPIQPMNENNFPYLCLDITLGRDCKSSCFVFRFAFICSGQRVLLPSAKRIWSHDGLKT